MKSHEAIRAARRFATGLLLLQAVAAPALAQAPADGGATMLDPVFVEASTGNPWRYLSGRGYEIISRCPGGFNEAYARALGRAAQARLSLLPAAFWGELATPLKIVLYNRAPEHRDDAGLASPIDLSWEPEDGSIIGSGSVVLSHPVTVGDGDTFINCGNYWGLQSESGDLSADPDSALLLEMRLPRLPAWFLAGLEGPEGLFANRIIRSGPVGDSVILPNAVWISYADTAKIRNESKRRDRAAPRPMIALGDLFRGAVREDQMDLWNSEASLLVRWGLFGPGNRQAFLAFVDDATRQPITEGMFRAHLGISYAEALRRLGEYLPAAVGEQVRVPLGGQPEEPLEAREAAPSEVARILGDWGRMEARHLGPQYADYKRDCLDQADRQLSKAVARKGADPLLLAAYGLYALQTGEEEKAREALEAATRAGVFRPRAYVELARLRLERALPSVQQGIGDLGDADYAGILALLETARAQMPALVSSYTVLARVLEHAPARPSGQDLAVLDNALDLFPQDARLAYTVATLHLRLGEPQHATAIIARAIAFSESGQARSLLASFGTWANGQARPSH